MSSYECCVFPCTKPVNAKRHKSVKTPKMDTNVPPKICTKTPKNHAVRNAWPKNKIKSENGHCRDPQKPDVLHFKFHAFLQ